MAPDRSSVLEAEEVASRGDNNAKDLRRCENFQREQFGKVDNTKGVLVMQRLNTSPRLTTDTTRNEGRERTPKNDNRSKKDNQDEKSERKHSRAKNASKST